MYYPKSQIKTNLYTRGKEFVFSDTNQEYRGYYYITSTGQVYSGKTPSDPTSQPLQSSGQNVSDTATQQRDVEPEFIGSLIEDASFYLLPLSYINSTSLDVGSSPLPPKQTYPIPTENDYKLGEFQRYFLKKSNELKFIEISLEDYRKYTTQDRNVMFELYTPIQINWILTGEEKQVYQVNQGIVARTEREQNLPGFTQYFRGRFTQFYK
jgi:hypothetical protein